MAGHTIFAALCDRRLTFAERLGAMRAEFVGGAGGRVLELGAGTGANPG